MASSTCDDRSSSTLAGLNPAQVNHEPRYLDTTLSFEERAADLVSRMTLEEKVSQMLHDAPAIERLGIPSYNWWNECVHGVARAGIATVFPQAIGLAATFNPELVGRVAEVIADEARAKHHEFVRRGERDIYKGLTFWSPNINIFRDPRWGRGQETYGEDPYLTARLGVAFIRGLQGDDPKYLKLVATPKHFAVHSGPERERHCFDARVSQKDLYETYLPAFKASIKEGGAASIMGAYNRVNGEPCCGSRTLLQKILRDDWGFEGYVVSDCWAIKDFHLHHKVTANAEESAALAVRNGCDLNCGCTYPHLVAAVNAGLISEDLIDQAVIRLFTARFRLGLFDPPEMVPYAQIPYEVNDSPAHRALALRAARESIVLLKNQDGLLPLPKTIRSVAVIGPNADNLEALYGNYNGVPSSYVTVYTGIRAKLPPTTEVICVRGCLLKGARNEDFTAAMDAARRADVSILCLGLSPLLEGEEAETQAQFGDDRTSLDLPGVQEELLEAVCALGKPVVLVLMNGGPLTINWAEANVPAIIEAWYPGEEGGTALADVIFGDYNPAGRLPVTIVRSTDDLPPFTDYAMQGRTYRFIEKEPLYTFGYGLSYTTFAYSRLTLGAPRIATGESLTVTVTVENTGAMAGDEVIQLYLKRLDAGPLAPHWQLRGVRRLPLAPGERTEVAFTLSPEDMVMVNEEGRSILEPGRYRIFVGGSQPDARSVALTGVAPLSADFETTGRTLVLA